MDPYFDSTLWTWFLILCSRVCSGAIVDPTPDEIQFIVMGLFAVGASFLGVFLVLKKLTMMTNALSHTMMLGIVVAIIATRVWGSESAYPVSAPGWAIVCAALVTSSLTGYLIQRLTSVRVIKEDASNAMVFSALFALAVTILSVWTRNTNAGAELLMGDPDALEASDIPIVFGTTCCTIFLGMVLLRGLTMAIFEPTFATVAGFRPFLFMHGLVFMAALTSVSAFRAVGFVMTLTFFVTPPLISRLWAHTVWHQLVASSAIGLGAVAFSVALSRHLLTVYALPVSTGALAAIVLALFYVIAIVTTQVVASCSRKCIGP
jgi:manganese/zinc/iron transport system permease protein